MGHRVGRWSVLSLFCQYRTSRRKRATSVLRKVSMIIPMKRLMSTYSAQCTGSAWNEEIDEHVFCGVHRVSTCCVVF
eukprot:1577468-Rhodomonas_salina.4